MALIGTSQGAQYSYEVIVVVRGRGMTLLCTVHTCWEANPRLSFLSEDGVLMHHKSPKAQGP